MTSEEVSDEVGKLLENIYYHFGEGSRGFAEKHNLNREQKWILEQAGKLRQVLKQGNVVLVGEVAELESKLDELEDERDELRDELENANDRIEKLETENSTLKDELDFW